MDTELQSRCSLAQRLPSLLPLVLLLQLLQLLLPVPPLLASAPPPLLYHCRHHLRFPLNSRYATRHPPTLPARSSTLPVPLPQFLHNVSINLKDGGYFIGTVPDGKRVNECIKQ